MAIYFNGLIFTATRLVADSLLESLGGSFELHTNGDRIRQEASVFYLSTTPRGMGFGVSLSNGVHDNKMLNRSGEHAGI